MMPSPFDNEPVLPQAQDRTPFERVLSPDNDGTLTSFMGRFYGIPSAEERKAAAEADVMRRLSGHLETAGDPQRAILDFMKTEQGLQLMKQPNMISTIEKWKQTIMPSEPKIHNLGPGQMGIVTKDGKITERIANPTTEQQNFNALAAKLSNASPELLDTLIINTMNPNEIQNRNIHLQRLVEKGLVTPEEAHNFAAGVIDVVQGTDDLGQPNGQKFLVNKIKGSSKLLSVGGGSAGSGVEGGGGAGTTTVPTPSRELPSNDPTLPPHLLPSGARSPDGTINPAYLTEVKYMGLGTGPFAKALSLAGVALRQVNPSNPEESSRLASMRQQQLKMLDVAMTAIGTSGSGRLKTQLDVTRDLLPSGWTDPLDAYDKLGQLHDYLTSVKAGAYSTYRNVATPRSVREEARKDVELINNALATLPLRSDIEQMKKDIVVTPPGAHPGTQPITPAAAGRGLMDMGKNAVGSAKQSAQEFLGGAKQPPRRQSARDAAPAPQQAQPVPAQQQPTVDINLDAVPPTATTPAQVQLQQQAMPSLPDIAKMDETNLRLLFQKLPAGPSQEKEAIINRAKQLRDEVAKASKPKGE